MQSTIEGCNALLERFDESAPVGHRFHTVTRQDFVELVKCVKMLAETLQREHEEID
jgi:hypothetical protein